MSKSFSPKANPDLIASHFERVFITPRKFARGWLTSRVDDSRFYKLQAMPDLVDWFNRNPTKGAQALVSFQIYSYGSYAVAKLYSRTKK